MGGRREFSSSKGKISPFGVSSRHRILVSNEHENFFVLGSGTAAEDGK